jgi:hypothetical protein
MCGLDNLVLTSDRCRCRLAKAGVYHIRMRGCSARRYKHEAIFRL